MKNYKAVLFAPDGSYATDVKDNADIQDVWEEIANFGSRWIFYPIPFVATDKRIADAPEGLEFLQGKAIKTVQKFLSREWKKRAEAICEGLNEGAPLWYIY